jgi:hypothetical protein
LSAGKAVIGRELAVAVAIFAGWGLVGSMVTFREAWRVAPLRVGADLVALQGIEDRREVASVNILPEAMWDRLWANGFLLRKPQYFATYTYEGRRNTELRGEWDLRDGLVRVQPATERGVTVGPSGRFTLQPRAEGMASAIGLAGDWFSKEMEPRTGETWRWTGAEARIVFENKTSAVRRGYLVVTARALGAGVMKVRVGGEVVAQWAWDTSRMTQQTDWVELVPGQTVVTLTGFPTQSAGAGDSRELGICVYAIEWRMGE